MDGQWGFADGMAGIADYGEYIPEKYGVYFF